MCSHRADPPPTDPPSAHHPPARRTPLLPEWRGPAWQLDPPVQLGPRRVKISGRDGETRVELELTRTQLGSQIGGQASDHGWMLTEVKDLAAQPSSAAAAPAAEPSPTAP